MNIVVNSAGCVDKNNIHAIHNKILAALVDPERAAYLEETKPFVASLVVEKSESIIDAFRRDRMTRVDLKQLFRFFAAARRHSPELRVEQNQSLTCSECRAPVGEQMDGEIQCDSCGYVYDARLAGMKDVECINSCKSYYSLKVNLLRTIYRYEGKKCFVGDVDLQEIKNELLHRRIRIEDLRLEHISTVLKDLKMSKYYDDVRTIYRLIAGGDCGRARIPIGEYIPQILKLHEELEYAYNYVKNPERINSLNVHYKLFKLIQLCGVDCAISDFYTLKTEQKYEEHEAKWRDICKITGWKVL